MDLPGSSHSVVFFFFFCVNDFAQVCKRTGHEAGFQGATYIDCPMKPCFLCKTPGKSHLSNLKKNVSSIYIYSVA